MYQWKNQVVLITGAATGIGAEVVKLLVEEGVKHVAVLDVDKDASIELLNELNWKCGKNIVKYHFCDVTDEEVFIDIYESVKNEYGYIDVVINNAGILNDSKKIYKKMIQINVTAVVTGTLKAIDEMRKDKGGRGGTVINISSIAGLLQFPVAPIYYATKSAVLQFSNCIGMEAHYSRTGVRVLAICFGCTDTAILSKEKLGCFDPDFEDTMYKMLLTTPIQTPVSAAKGLIEAFKRGDSGTTWLVDDSKSAQDISADIREAYNTMGSKVTLY